MTDRPTLQQIGQRHNCDKFTVHHYESVYTPFLEPLRDRPLRLLEIGIGGEDRELGGASLLTWQEYFSSAQIVGIDLFDKSALDTERIATEICDQRSQHDLAALVVKHGPFDIIIDDGSHIGHDVATSLFGLFGSLTEGGLYFVEDLQTSYWPEYGGSSVASMTVDTAVRWLKLAVDIVNRAEILDTELFPLRAGFRMSQLHVYHNIAVLVANDGPEPSSAVLDLERRLERLTADRMRNAELVEMHDRLVGDPGAFLELLEAVARLGGADSVIAMSASEARAADL